MLPDEHLIKLPVLDLWQLRAKAATKGNKLTLPELGRVLYHLNQKRGYKHAKSDESSDKNQREYVANVNARYANIKQLGKTIGQFFAEKLEENQVITEKGKFYTYRIKDNVFPRKAYEEEFDQIMECPREFYPEILADEFINKLRNEIIYYQRKLKSCKHLVSLCEFEKRAYTNKDGKVVYDGPKVAPRTSPLFQVCKIWESVNNLKIKNRKNDELYIFRRQLLNEHYFGNVIIMNEGDVYLNLFEEKIGNIYEDNDIISLLSNTKSMNSWYLTRDKVQPCKHCVYKYLCPSISNYEFILKKMNLCKNVLSQ